jgi:phage antirepressor YoqD-like protein
MTTQLPSQKISSMSSTEIAQLTDKQKKHIHQDIKDQLFVGLYGLKDGQDFDHVKIQGITVILDKRGYWSEVLLDREHTLTLITGYDVKSRHAINKRWLELENQQPSNQLNPANLSRLQLLEMAIQSEQERLLLEAKVTDLQPKADALDRIATGAEGSLNITNAAKALQMRPKDLFAWLSANRWIYRRMGGKGWVAYQDRIQGGLLEHKVTTVERSDGTEKVVEQVLVLPKGLAKLSAAIMLTNVLTPRNGLVELQGVQS